MTAEYDTEDKHKLTDREYVLDAIAHLISGRKLDNELFNFYFSHTEIGFMNHEALYNFLRGE